MALTPRLDLRQSQSLVMTPQLQQAIKLLQLSNIELSAFVEQELEQNPLLERSETSAEENGATERGNGPDDDDAPEGQESRPAPESDDLVLDRAPAGEETPLDIDYDNTWNSDSGADAVAESDAYMGAYSGSGGRSDFGDSETSLEQTMPNETSLREHLVGQINMDISDPIDRAIGLLLVEMLDESGWLAGNLDDIANRLGCDSNRVADVLARLQRLDPPGVFARNLKECLALQLRDQDRLDPAMQTLLDNLELLARRDFAGLSRICGVDAEDIADMVAEIKCLNPKPGLAFDHEVIQAVTPDIIMRPAQGGGWIVELNSDTLPRVLINERYYSKINSSARSKEEKQYISDRFQQANWLVRSLHQRATTILKVASEIVRRQDAFFAKGVLHLRPLVLRDIASAVEMHESTVSRVTANKYMSTPRGIFELKYFFTQAIAAASGGESHSAEAVRHRIKILIDAEPIDDVLSDDKIVDILRKDGIDIARRTVAKYREALNIASSVQRRREKATGQAAS